VRRINEINGLARVFMKVVVMNAENEVLLFNVYNGFVMVGRGCE
jgi:hypothetical protein